MSNLKTKSFPKKTIRPSSISSTTAKAVSSVNKPATKTKSNPELKMDAGEVVKSWEATALVIKEFMEFSERFGETIDSHKQAMEEQQIAADAKELRDERRAFVTRCIVVASVVGHLLIPWIYR